MANSLDVVIKYIGDASSATKAAKEVSSGYDKLAGNLQKTGLKLTAAVTLPIVAAGAAFMNELQNAEKVAAQTNAAIKSTGSAAGVSAREVDRLAQSLQKKSGIDDDAIASGQNLLLTFTAVHDEAGKGNNIFKQATKAALDLSVAFGKDMSESSILVGKALQDPIAGVTALQRVGIKLSDSQKELIKNLVESGDVMGAQKVILGELNTQVGGSAKAYGETLAGQVERAKNEVLNVGAAMVTVAAPGLKILASAASGLASVMAELPAPVQAAVSSFALLLAAVGPISTAVGTFMKMAPAFGKAFEFIHFQALLAAEALGKFSAAQILATAGIATLIVAVAAVGLWFLRQASASEQATEAGKEWAQTAIENAKAGTTTAQALSQLEAKERVLAAALGEAREAQAAFNDQMGGSAAQIKKNADASNDLGIKIADLEARHTGLTGEIKNLKREQELAEEAAKNQALALNEVATAARGVTGATEEQITAITTLNNATLAAQGGIVGYEAAQIRVEEAQNKLNATLADTEATELDVRKATNDLAAAKLAAAGAAYTLQISEADLARVMSQQGVPGLTAMRDTLQETINKHGDATGAIQAQINKINDLIATADKVQTEKTMKLNVVVDFPDKSVFGNQFERFHMGGVVPGPRGSERLALVQAGETIIPAGHSTVGTTSPTGGGSTFNISVNVEAGVAPAEVGAKVVDAIRQYERVAGKGWRA